MAGRSQERDQIIAFIKPFITSGDAKDQSILYISGSPGTGKTAMVNSVLTELRVELEAADIRTFTINCMALNNIEALWDRFKDEFQEEPRKETKASKTKKGKETSFETVKRILASQSKKCVVLLDELDHIASSSQSLDVIFNTIEKYQSHIRLIGIANTHTLSAHASTEISAQATGGVKTLHFSPYTAKQLLEILQARLSPLSESKQPTSEKADTFLPLPTLILLTKKIAAQTGDVRAVFEVLRGAIDIAVNSNESANPLAEPTPPVTPAHVLSALKAYTPASNPTQSATASPSPVKGPSRKASDSEVVNKVRDLSLQARLAVVAAVLARKRLDLSLPISGSAPNTPTSTPRKRGQAAPSSGAIDASHLHSFYKTILARSDNGAFVAVSRSEFNDLMNVLETVGLVTLSSASTPGSPSKSGRRTASFGAMLGKGTSQEIRFVEGVRMDEIMRGLGISDDAATASGDIKEEEIKGLWESEKVRISRESKIRRAGGSPSGAFEDATED
ncbi:hypothetical protein EIP86_004904 [Pleurotus ostreatoroseus]|nr:hypothetical protein EIP86_004904 [Pleurotus ostreatoroseus]